MFQEFLLYSNKITFAVFSFVFLCVYLAFLCGFHFTTKSHKG